jgi:hypothetical protein
MSVFQAEGRGGIDLTFSDTCINKKTPSFCRPLMVCLTCRVPAAPSIIIIIHFYENYIFLDPIDLVFFFFYSIGRSLILSIFPTAALTEPKKTRL